MPVPIRSLLVVTAFAAALTATAAHAQKKYDPGASDTEIKIGNIMPYSGPASAYGVIGKAQAAYFNKINAEGDRTGAQAGRKRRGAADLPVAGNAVQFGDHEIHEHQEGAAAVRRLRRHQIR